MTNPDRTSDTAAFLTAVTLITTGVDGFPTAGQALEVTVTARLAGRILETNLAHAGDPVPPVADTIAALARSFLDVIETCRDGSRDPDIAQAWFRARAEI